MSAEVVSLHGSAIDEKGIATSVVELLCRHDRRKLKAILRKDPTLSPKAQLAALEKF